MKKLFILAVVITASGPAWAIKYYKGSGGSISNIDAGAFDACAKIYYRNAAKSELSKSHSTALMKASLKGEVVNDLSAVTNILKNTGGCTYGSDSEKF